MKKTSFFACIFVCTMVAVMAFGDQAMAQSRLFRGQSDETARPQRLLKRNQVQAEEPAVETPDAPVATSSNRFGRRTARTQSAWTPFQTVRKLFPSK